MAIQDVPEVKFVSSPTVFLEAGNNEVRLFVYNFIRKQNGDLINVCINCNEKGEQKSLLLFDDYKVVPHLALSGRNFFYSTDVTPTKSTWSRLWFWISGDKKAAPLLSRELFNDPASWWQKVLTVKRATDSITPSVDNKSTIYLTLKRWVAHRPSARTFQISGEWPEDQNSNFDHALVVLNPQRQVIGYVPWHKTYLEDDEWIFPLPDGSGFYRQEFAEKELRIYFHPLPKSK